MGALGLQAQALVQRAAQAGMPRAWELLSLSPRQIELEMQALSARRQLEAERMDLQAWLTGRYVMAALHAPRRFPRRPNGVHAPRTEMNDDEMKRVFSALANQRREQDGHS